MKKKINLLYIIISVSAIFLTLVATTSVYYSYSKREMMENLKVYAHILEIPMQEENYNSQTILQAVQDDIRITVIAPDGVVSYDNEADAANMENHKNRPEVQAALQDGVGTEIRKSDTFDKNTFYYAIRMDNGNVLRVAREADSILKILSQAFPLIACIAGFLIVSSIFFSSVLTTSIVKPIERLANHLDMTESVVTYKELMPFMNMIQKQHEDIMKAAKMRQEFTANVSHELKTPLTSISGYSELIENGMASNEDSKRFAGEIHKNAQRLLTLINDILRLSELDVSDGADIAYEAVDLKSLAENCINMLTLSAEKHEVQVVLRGESCWIDGNRQMLEELIYNLCDNAIRYNNRGGKVEVLIQDMPEQRQAKLVVKDTGIGIPKEHQERIFERFYRVDKSRSKATGGTGLGLAIVKHIVSQHNADITLESEMGVGTTITILFHKKEK